MKKILFSVWLFLALIFISWASFGVAEGMTRANISAMTVALAKSIPANIASSSPAAPLSEEDLNILKIIVSVTGELADLYVSTRP